MEVAVSSDDDHADVNENGNGIDSEIDNDNDDDSDNGSGSDHGNDNGNGIDNANFSDNEDDHGNHNGYDNCGANGDANMQHVWTSVEGFFVWSAPPVMHLLPLLALSFGLKLCFLSAQFLVKGWLVSLDARTRNFLNLLWSH